MEERAVLYLILDKKKPRASCNLMRQTRAPSQKKTARPLQLHEKQQRAVYPSVGKKGPPVSLGKAKKIVTIPFTSSQDGREHVLFKEEGWNPSQASKQEVCSRPEACRTKK